MAGSTGLEPAASGVTGRRSNQLNYDPEQEHDPDRRFRRLSLSTEIRDVRWWLGSASLPAVSSPRVTRRALSLPSRSSPRVTRRAKAGGRYRTRTCDSRRVKPVLYQLS
jgi:hypothetical protein